MPFSTFSFNYGYVGKQPVAWKEYCVEYWFKELQDSTDRCTAWHDIAEIMFKNGVNSLPQNHYF